MMAIAVGILAERIVESAEGWSETTSCARVGKR